MVRQKASYQKPEHSKQLIISPKILLHENFIYSISLLKYSPYHKMVEGSVSERF